MKKKKSAPLTSSFAKSSPNSFTSSADAGSRFGFALKICATKPKFNLSLPDERSLDFTMGLMPMAVTAAIKASARV